MKPLSKQSEVVTKAALRAADMLGITTFDEGSGGSAHDREAREPFLCYLRDDGTLVIGMGDHDCSLFKPTLSQLRNLERDSVNYVIREDLQVRPPPRDTGV